MTSNENTNKKPLPKDQYEILAAINGQAAQIEMEKAAYEGLKAKFLERFAKFKQGQGVLYGNHRFIVDAVEFDSFDGVRYNLRPWHNRNSPHVYSPGDIRVMQISADLRLYEE